MKVNNVVDSSILDYLRYNKETGSFVWVNSRDIIKEVKRFGIVINNKGYVQIIFKNKRYLAHRLAYWFVNGDFPKKLIYHINRDRADNRWINLAEMSRPFSLKSTNKSGFSGVRFVEERGKYRAEITVKGKTKHLGYYVDLREAIKARKKANITYGFNTKYNK